MKKQKKTTKPQVAIVMGSKSDLEVMKEAAVALEQFGIGYEILVSSAHRAPKQTAAFAEGARKKGYRVIIAGAGGAAHLPGVIASLTELPVIGVPVPSGPLRGEDALLSIVQMPKGVPVACVAIGGAFNAGVLAAQILGLYDRVASFKDGLSKK
jgi:5-(carboxyamino)imidazole ribonucleotide mutase